MKTSILTGKILHDAYSQAIEEIVAAHHLAFVPSKPWRMLSARDKEAYRHMAAILNKQLLLAESSESPESEVAE